MASLRQECKQRFKVAFDEVRAVSGSLTFILVVDDRALKVLSNTIKMMELINYGITSVERLELKRKKFHKIQAVYLIHPDSYQLLLDDYSVQGEPQYHTIHVLTLAKIPIKVMNELSNNGEFVKRVKSLKEININFALQNHNQFAVAEHIKNTFGKSMQDGNDFQKMVSSTVDQLTTVVTSFSSFFIVEILYSKPVNSNFSEKVALGLKERLEGMFKTYDKMQSNSFNSSSPQTTFIILDRSFDAVSPLVRDFHYLPLLYELKGVKNHKLTGIGKDKKKIHNFADGDDIFLKYRYQHIARTASGVQKDFQDFSHNHVAAKFEKNKESEGNMENMAEVMKKIPQYGEAKDRFSIHLDMVGEIMESYNQNNQKKIGQLQQSIISLTSSQGKKVKSDDLLSQVYSYLKQIDDPVEKARLLTISLMCLEIKPKDKSILVTEFEKLGKFSSLHKSVSLLTGHGPCVLNPKKQKMHKEDNLILDKHLPRIQEIVKEVSTGGQADLKFVRVGSEAKSQKPNHKAGGVLGRKKIGFDKQQASKPRIIVFVASAIGYNQIRSLSQFEDNYHLIVGSHNFVTPQEYLRQINDL